ncbi:hypothetical protein BTUL_0033g00270 [Botrytis tulipae]|uniref:Uncharacterized protein n=1 Tax=Botrytis tulipae TaxID=87230 RepID=A0A4Z1EXA5_9HELO|nr:hypothetical protein BTUL_0033g00270 [Botrytis tulipae]
MTHEEHVGESSTSSVEDEILENPNTGVVAAEDRSQTLSPASHVTAPEEGDDRSLGADARFDAFVLQDLKHLIPVLNGVHEFWLARNPEGKEESRLAQTYSDLVDVLFIHPCDANIPSSEDVSKMADVSVVLNRGVVTGKYRASPQMLMFDGTVEAKTTEVSGSKRMTIMLEIIGIHYTNMGL